MQFDFGKNWADFSEKALTPERVGQARQAFASLLEPAGGVTGRSFIDIGFGQGLGLLTAAATGARASGIDINPTCGEVLERNRRLFPELGGSSIPVLIGSVLDESVVAQARKSSPGGAGYDIVHSWGVLHHTGNMRQAVANAASLVKSRGYFVVALYNRHWSSKLWLLIKFVYCKSPPFLQRLLVAVMYPVIYLAKWIVTGSNPRHQLRGMDFYFDVIDWVGGYPYEYASHEEVLTMVEPMGFTCTRFIPSQVPTGCNEFVFRRR